MEPPNFSNKDLNFKLPFGLIISGPSSSGKSTFLLKFISQAAELIDPPPKSILYCFGEMSNIVPILQKSGVSVFAGVPQEDVIKRIPKPSLVILDDLLLSIDEKYLSELFTKKSHHQKFSIVFVTQNLFEKKIKVARQNAQYLVLMRSPNSVLSVRNIGTQLFPKKLDYFLDAYRQATNEPYGYLLIDMHASSDPTLRLPKTRSERKRRRLLKQANTQHLLAIAEICLNIVKARYKLTTRQRKRLLPYAGFVRRMSRARSEKGARKLLIQKGNGVGGVLAALLTPILIEIGRNIIKSDSDKN
uniref:AAA+ ATPase domain-containing protein n=1 Tax=Meloidogyne hapla TaxID=6305 RepID=A0A1I8AXK8_MELHA